MSGTRRRAGGLIGLLTICILAGCASERAHVSFGYVVNPERGLPDGMKTIAIEPPVLGPNTDAKWSDLCVRTLQHLVNEARNRYGADVVLVDRIDTQAFQIGASDPAQAVLAAVGHQYIEVPQGQEPAGGVFGPIGDPLVVAAYLFAPVNRISRVDMRNIQLCVPRLVFNRP